uniref:HIRAN domain-containing protein n=1 Tax=Amphimedon queenslandica TaxID=400682 RepID=A0A1X7ST59_AMPQE
MAELALSSFELQSHVRGYHVYSHLWTPVLEVLGLSRETNNEHDRYAVAIMKDDYVAGHVPLSLSKVFHYFLMKPGHSAVCKITGGHVNRGVQLGIEVPCVYIMYGQTPYIEKLKVLLKH